MGLSTLREHIKPSGNPIHYASYYIFILDVALISDICHNNTFDSYNTSYLSLIH